MEQQSRLIIRLRDLQHEVDAWAKAERIIDQNQHLLLFYRINESDSTKNTLTFLEMKAADFFTEERFKAAKVRSRMYRHRIIQMIKYSNLAPKIILVRDLQFILESEYLQIGKFGRGSYRAMKNVLAHHGIQLS